MKNLTNFIKESVVNEANTKKYKNITVGDFFSWFTGEDFSHMDVKSFVAHGLDYLSDDNFDGDVDAMFDFLQKNAKAKITLEETPTEYDDIEHYFELDDKEFYVQSMARYGKKQQ